MVAEGLSEFVVVEALLAAIEPGAEFERLWPNTQVGGRPYGWRGVKAWCEENSSKLETFLRGVEGREIDLLVVHLDGTMAHNVKAQRPCPPAKDTADALRGVIGTWLARTPLPPWLVPMTPMQSTDAWVVAALFPPYIPKRCLGCAAAGTGCPHPLECDPDPESDLVRRKLLRRKNGEVKKPERDYLPLAKGAAAAWATVSARCTEAARFEQELRAAVAAAPSFWP
ncbi:MAG: hypothetical protein U0325_25235 [Polyangiales bacterium]